MVIRELNVAADELYVCKRDVSGRVTLESLAIVPNIQGRVRTNAEAFLGSKIIACEGPTEIGCLRAYDLYRLDRTSPPVWALATAYFNCTGGGRIAPACRQLVSLGYRTAALCDNDAPDQLSAETSGRAPRLWRARLPMAMTAIPRSASYSAISLGRTFRHYSKPSAPITIRLRSRRL